MPLVDTLEGEVTEGVVEVVIDAHNIRLVLDSRVESGDAQGITIVCEHVVDVSGQGLDVGQAADQGVAGPRSDECLVEQWCFARIAGIRIDPVTSHEGVVQIQLASIGEEAGLLGQTLGGDHLAL